MKKMMSLWADILVLVLNYNTHRVLRIIAGQFSQRLRAVFFQWWRAIRVVKAVSFEENNGDAPPEYENPPLKGSSVKMDKDAEISRLKYEVINLKAALHEVSKEKELPGLLAAERALVRYDHNLTTFLIMFAFLLSSSKYICVCMCYKGNFLRKMFNCALYLKHWKVNCWNW